MAKISKHLGLPAGEAIPGVCGPGPIQKFHHLVGEEGLRSCIITSEKDPKKGGFYFFGDTGYCISAKAVSNRDGMKGFITLGIVIGDAIADSGMTSDMQKFVIDTIVQNIAYGIRYTMDLSERTK